MGHPVPRDELVFEVVRLGAYVVHVRTVAERAGAGARVVAELTDMVEGLAGLHVVALVAGGWCASDKCSAELTDAARSPSGARHCRRCRVGWSLVEVEGRLRAVSRPWPVSAEGPTEAEAARGAIADGRSPRGCDSISSTP